MPSDAPLWVAVGVAVLVSFFALAAGIDVDPVLVFENMTYGEMSIDDGFVITISDADTYYNITGFDWNFSTTNKVYFNGSALYINESGTYLAWHFESFSGSVNTEFHLTLGVNGVTQQECETHRKLGAGGDVGSSSNVCILDLVEGDYVVYQVENNDGTKDMTLSHVNVGVLKLEGASGIV